MKATVKTVSFIYNGTDINSLKVDKVEPKAYPDKKPLWGVEYTGNRLNTSQIDLLWGMVSDKYENHRNISTVRQESCMCIASSISFFCLMQGPEDRVLTQSSIPTRIRRLCPRGTHCVIESKPSRQHILPGRPQFGIRCDRRYIYICSASRLLRQHEHGSCKHQSPLYLQFITQNFRVSQNNVMSKNLH